MAYHCPVCRKISPDSMDLARHFLGQNDSKHKDWLKTKGLSYGELIMLQVTEFGNRGYETLAEIFEKEAKVDH
jgi:hypothetical protein